MIKYKLTKLTYVLAFVVAAIPLIHAIPAVTLVYIASIGAIILAIINRKQLKWIVVNAAILVGCTLFLLAPFIINFKNESSPALIAMIKKWQLQMMFNELTGKIPDDLWVTALQINNRAGVEITIISAISVVILIYLKRYKEVMYATIMSLTIYILIFNSGYWFLPLSEVLYPERIAYFMIFCWTFYFGYVLTGLENKVITLSVFRYKLNAYHLLAILLAGLSIKYMTDTSLGLSKGKQINCNKETRAAFRWINDSTESEALFVATYADAGMWIPAFTNRATLGTHIHFIHEVTHVWDSLEASDAPRYYFITKKDKANNEAMSRVANMVKLFSNNEVEIYH